jgi:hypothetical protein
MVFRDHATIVLWRDPAYTLRAESGGFRLEFEGEFFDPARLARDHVRRFRLERDSAQRIPPVALTPDGFVDEWLGLPWEEAWRWSSPGALALSDWHRRLTEDGHFMGEVVHISECEGQPQSWEVAVDRGGYRGPEDLLYFHVGRTSPEEFSMFGVNAQSASECPLSQHRKSH